MHPCDKFFKIFTGSSDAYTAFTGSDTLYSTKKSTSIKLKSLVLTSKNLLQISTYISFGKCKVELRLLRFYLFSFSVFFLTIENFHSFCIEEKKQGSYPINTFFPSKAKPYFRIFSFGIPLEIKVSSYFFSSIWERAEERVSSDQDAFDGKERPVQDFRPLGSLPGWYVRSG